MSDVVNRDVKRRNAHVKIGLPSDFDRRLAPLFAFACAVLLLSCKPSAKRTSTDRWLTVAKHDSMLFAVDTHALVRSAGNTFRAWVKVSYKQDQPSNTAVSFKPYRNEVDRMDFDCDRRRMSRRLTAYYDSAGNHLGEAPQDSAWADVLPAGVGEMLADTTCSFGRSRRLRVAP
jgi:hypothetical protein